MAAIASALERAAAGIKSEAVLNFLRRPKQLLINGNWVPAKSGRTFATINPANEEVLAHVAEGDSADVDEAVRAARKALDGKWSSINPHRRAGYLLKVADLIEKHAEELATLESLNNGMAISNATRMANGAATTFRYYAGWATKIYGETNPSDPSMFNYTLREPVGVCGQIIPWNGPVSMFSWKIAPALACGNVSIIKPAEQTPLTALRLGELLLEAGIPEGVVNIITGYGESAGAAIAGHPGIDKVAFTGSTEVGKLILKASAGNLKRVSLELGGKSPNIVFADANMEECLPTSLAGFTMLSGQVCSAGTRVFVQRDFHDEFVERFTRQAAQAKAGDPLDPKTTIGPLVSKEQFERVRSYLDIGKREGAQARLGGEVRQGRGYFVDPTIFTHVKNDMRIAREEIFGPVASVIPFKDEDDAVLQGNDTTYGLAAAVWTNDVRRAHKVARALKAGTVWVNCYNNIDPISPFGGYKQSGIGRELGKQSIDLYTQIKSVYLRL
jgi:acyl-CoA reductase-like NAD-dependent aldehyde dehydrogenase